MDTLNALVTILGNGFFPIAVCGVMFWYINKKDAAHKAEIDELRTAVDQNTKAIELGARAIDQNNELIKEFIKLKGDN